MHPEKLLHKYLNREATLQEIELLKAHPEYRELYQIAKASEGFEVPEHDAKANLEKIFASKNVDSKPLMPRWIAYGISMAAIGVILLAGYFFLQNMATTITTQIAEQHSFELPEGSLVHLNANSEVSYNKRSWGDQRKVDLEGEAFFKVKKGATFQVITDKGTVTVLGTEFNVFSRENIFRVTCFEGSVKVNYGEDSLQLKAGERMSFEDGVLKTNMAVPDTRPSWMYRESSFTNASLRTILKELENQYPIEINWSEDLSNIRFTGSFTHDNLEVALQTICTPLNLTYKIQGNQVSIYEE